MNGLWVRFWKLSGRERRDFFLGLLLVPAAMILLRFFTFRRVQRAVEKRYSDNALAATRDDAAIFADVRATSRMIDAASRYGLTRGNCLSRSMALWWLLRRRGIPVHLCIGARKSGEQFEAHSWVEMAGRAVNDSEDVTARYSAFDGPISGEMAPRK